jgi:membrane-associated HD superfamily phosphohydrolase
MPKEGKFNYEFDINTPWKYGLLQASFDFPIHKSEQQVQKEQDSLLAYYQPYFIMDKNVEKNIQAKFREDYNQTLKFSLPSPDYYRHIERILKRIYEKGILSTNDVEFLAEDSISSISIVEKNVAVPKTVNNLFTVKEAYEYLLNADTLHYNKRILQSCNLNNYLTSNLTYDEEKSETALKELQSSISYAKGLVLDGQKIIDRGEIINEHTYDILNSLQKEWERRSESAQEVRLTFMGQALLVGVLILCFMIYLELFRKNYFERKRSVLLLFTLIVSFPVILSIMVEQNLSNVYMVPLAMIPIIIGIFLDSRTAFMAHTTIILI